MQPPCKFNLIQFSIKFFFFGYLIQNLILSHFLIIFIFQRIEHIMIEKVVIMLVQYRIYKVLPQDSVQFP